MKTFAAATLALLLVAVVPIACQDDCIAGSEALVNNTAVVTSFEDIVARINADLSDPYSLKKFCTFAEGSVTCQVNVGAYSIPKELLNGTDVVAFLSLRRVDCYRFLQRMESGSGLKWGECRPEKYNLSSRELEVLEMASNGLGTAGIAETLSISSHTVKNHFKNIFSKLKVHSRTEAVSLALRMNFFSTP